MIVFSTVESRLAVINARGFSNKNKTNRTLVVKKEKIDVKVVF